MKKISNVGILFSICISYQEINLNEKYTNFDQVI